MNVTYLRKIILLCLFCVFSGHILLSQKYDSLLAKRQDQFKEEKVAVHLNKDAYQPGEIIWFKAYVFSGNFPSRISEVLHIDLLDSIGGLIKSQQLPMVYSTAAGSLKIPDAYLGRLWIRAYTKWMLNFDLDFVYWKPLSVNFSSSPNIPFTFDASAKRVLNSKSDIDIFPEGGKLVEGISTKCVVKCSNANGTEPIEFYGDLINQRDSVLQHFSSIHDGMGMIEFSPVKGDVYRVRLGNSGSTVTKQVPVSATGISIKIHRDKEKILYKIQLKNEVAGPAKLSIIAQMNNFLLYRKNILLESGGVAEGSLDTKGFPPGIIQFVVINPDEKNFAERLVFSNSDMPKTSLDLKLLSTAGPNGTVTKKVRLGTKDTIPSNFSFSISEEPLSAVEARDNIYSQLLLTSDFKGYIHYPSFYFSGKDSCDYLLDMLLLTKKWERFRWEDLVSGNFPAIKFFPEKSITFAGKIESVRLKSGNNVQINAILQTKDLKKIFAESTVYDDGRFEINNLRFFDSAQLYLSVRINGKDLDSKFFDIDVKDSLLSSVLYRLQIPILDFPKFETPYITDQNSLAYAELLNQKKPSEGIVLDTVIVSGVVKTKREQLNEEYTSGAFSDLGRGQIIIPDEDPSFLSALTVLDYLNGRISGMQVDVNASEDAVVWRGHPTAIFVNEISQTSTTLDGSPAGGTDKYFTVQDATYIKNIPVREVALIKIFPPPFVVANGNGAGGCIAIYLRKPAPYGKNRAQKVYGLTGFAKSWEGYSDLPTISNMLDRPNSKYNYWNPMVIFNRPGEEFFLDFIDKANQKIKSLLIMGCNEDGNIFNEILSLD